MRDMTSSVSQRGQVTIPIEVRERLGLKPKDRLRFRVEGDTVLIDPYRSNLAAFYGTVPALDPPRSWKEIEEIAHDEHAEHVAREGLD
jgi:antitoxin PrlF